MADLVAHVNNGFTGTNVYNGQIDTKDELGNPKDPIVITFGTPDVCVGKLTSHNPLTNTVVYELDHGGVEGVTTYEVRADGDLGPGQTAVVSQGTFTSLPSGATAVTESFSAERPTPAP